MAKTVVKRQTAGQASLQAASDTTKYDSLEVSHALCDKVLEQLWLCIDNHKHIIDEPEFCVVMNLAADPLLKNVMRQKYYAWPHLPSPRPSQSCFLYRKASNDLQFLWSLPDAMTMAELSEAVHVAKPWKRMKGWCDAFFKLQFWQHIRKQHNIKLLSEIEYLEANREKLVESCSKDSETPGAKAFDFSKVSVKQFGDPVDTSAAQHLLDRSRKAKTA